jgi:hypothetical protein
MVYSQVIIGLGLRFTREQLISLSEECDFKYYIDTDGNMVSIFMNEKDQKKEAPLTYDNNICCLADDKQSFYIYVPIQIYKRDCVKRGEKNDCKDCEEYTCCDQCLGKTTNGYYNVEKIRESLDPKDYECEYFCLFCGHDNKSKYQNCEKCKIKTESSLYINNLKKIMHNPRLLRDTLRDGNSGVVNDLNMLIDSKYYEEYNNARKLIKKFCKKHKFSNLFTNTELIPKLYYILDDCLSCG